MHVPDPGPPRSRDAAAQQQVWKTLIEERLTTMSGGPSRSPLDEAMRYALLAPAKRVRPLITLAAAQRYGATPAMAIDAACAVECVHTASLILDDLPCMDDARLRRGRASTHVAFGESTAVLAAIGLLGLAFEATAGAEQAGHGTPGTLTRLLSEAMGSRGLAAGQHADLDPVRGHLREADIRRTHGLKTGTLFAAAAEAGAVVAEAGREARADMRALGLDIGLMFQQLDDVTDATASEEQAGKDVRRDGGTATIIKLAGTKAATAAANLHMRQAIARLKGGPRPDPLEDLLVAFFGPRRR